MPPAFWPTGVKSTRKVGLRRRFGSPEKEQPVAIGRNVLVRMRAGTEEVSQFIMAAAEPGGRSWALEAPHGPVSAFDAPVVLLDGLIANDKFCLVRRTRLRLSWSRLSLRDRSARASAPLS